MTPEARRLPRRRKTGLELEEVGGELLVYDLERHRAHALRPAAGRVWRACDGKTTYSAAAARLREELAIPADEELVRLIVGRLARAHLVEEASTAPLYSRRELVRKMRDLGLAASFLLPLVTSIISPTPAQALTCIPHGGCAGVPDCALCENPGGACAPPWVCCRGQCMTPGQAQNICGC